jgi:hypothetical protein
MTRLMTLVNTKVVLFVTIMMLSVEILCIVVIIISMANSSHGGKRKHAGRKSNAAKLLEAGFVAPWFTQKFQEIKWLEFLDSEDAKIRLDACKYLSDRIYGKAAQSIEHSGEIDFALAERIAKARKRT